MIENAIYCIAWGGAVFRFGTTFIMRFRKLQQRMRWARLRRGPGNSEIRKELDRILGSSRFSSAQRSREFLRYVVDERLAGRSDKLKGATIAVDVFGKPRDFDSSTDPVVRVEARRLRQRLTEYYLTDGASNPVRIELPVGSYRPRFRHTGASDLRKRRLMRWAAVAGAVSLAAVGAFFVGFAALPMRSESPTGIDALPAHTPVPRVAVESFVNLTNNPVLDNFVAGLTVETEIRMSEFGLSVVPVSADGRRDGEFDGRPNQAPDVRYVLGGSVRQQGGSIRVSPRLIDAESKTQVWTASFDEELEGAGDIAVQERIGTRIAAIMANPFGPMYQREVSKIAALPTRELDSYGCILQFRAYAGSLDPAAHARSKRCFLHVADEQPRRSQIMAGLALIYLHELWYRYDPNDTPEFALKHARITARQALEIDSDNLLANLAMAGVAYSMGDTDKFLSAAKHALSLEHNPSTDAQIGSLLTLSGLPEHGRVLLDRAFAAQLSVPSWYYVARSFNAMLYDEYDQALEYALRANAPHWFASAMAIAASAGLAGNTEIAAESIDELLAADPDFARDGRARLGYWIRSPELVDRIVEGLRLGGLAL
jgi:TolB-like protein